MAFIEQLAHWYGSWRVRCGMQSLWYW